PVQANQRGAVHVPDNAVVLDRLVAHRFRPPLPCEDVATGLPTIVVPPPANRSCPRSAPAPSRGRHGRGRPGTLAPRMPGPRIRRTPTVPSRRTPATASL